MRRSSGVKRNFQGLKPEALLRLFLVLLLLYTFHNLFLSQLNVKRVLELKSASMNLQKQVEHYRLENAKMEQLLELVKSHPDHFNEKFARHYMQMQKEEELILIMKE